MDPNANLQQQLCLASLILKADDENKTVDSPEAVLLAELVVALDEWLRKGGFLPHAWEPPTVPFARRSTAAQGEPS